MRKVFLWSIVSLTFVFANIIDIYRQEGIDAVARVLDKELQKESYWKGVIGDRDVRFGYYSNIEYILVCSKKRKELDIYKIAGNDLKKLKRIKVIVGKNSGDKIKEGDLRTPVGVYRLTRKLTGLDDYYGPFAFTTTYPNLFDRIRGKNGHGIWIHGMPQNCEREPDTKGCIAMENDELQRLDDMLNLKKTILLINEDKPDTANKEEIVQILSMLYKWRYAWKNSDIKNYLRFYHSNFVRFDGKNLKEFSKMKQRIFASKKGDKIEIIFENINVIPYQMPGDERVYRVNFHEKYRSRSYRFEGDKELYISKTADGWKILVER
ncbi:L,D-transpeptidase family protein [Nitrosophilus alvini]|uniref:L,D-transpeptidase family protein n=1 Tax=Nitrosophilus alvini TaxID=2714855 RepID=UPI0019096C34|nr:L,D-transpeptidase family protein [Nitrosophilus alvini]